MADLQTKNYTFIPNGSQPATVYKIYTSISSGKIVTISDNTGRVLSYSEALQVLDNQKNSQVLANNPVWVSLGSSKDNVVNILAPTTEYNSQSAKVQAALLNENKELAKVEPTLIRPNENFLNSLTPIQYAVQPKDLIIFPQDLFPSGTGSNLTPDYLSIKALKYQPPNQGLLGGSTATATILSRGITSLNQGGNLSSFLEQNYEYYGGVILPMPLSVRDGVQAEWGVSNVNALGLGLAAAASGLFDVNKLTGKLLASGALAGLIPGENIINKAVGAGVVLGASGSLGKQLTSDVVAAAVNKLPLQSQVNPQDLLARSTGSVVNNNAEMLFRAPKIRAFDFAWKLTPRDDTDSSRIRRIIRFFKVNSLPSISNKDNGGSIFMETPNVFKIEYMKSGSTRNTSLPQPKICALVGMQVDHTPDGVGWSAYEDSHPTATTISLAFTELTPLFANQYMENGAITYSDDVGF